MQQRRGSQRSHYVPGAQSQRSLDVSGGAENSLWDRTDNGGWTARLPWKCGTHYIFSSGMGGDVYRDNERKEAVEHTYYRKRLTRMRFLKV